MKSLLIHILIGLFLPPFSDKTEIKPVEVLILGTFHMDSTQVDDFNPNVEDILGNKRQKEVLSLVKALERFKPTKIALEAPKEAAKIKKDYDLFLDGKLKLPADERYQIGFRIAKRFGHKNVFGVDHYLELNIEDLVKWAVRNGQDQKAKILLTSYKKANSTWTPSFMRTHDLKEIYRAFNSGETDLLLHSVILDGARIGNDEEPVGTEMLSKWYSRNIYIFSNILQIAEPNDRILVIYGAIHRKILIDLFNQLDGFRVVEAASFLGTE